MTNTTAAPSQPEAPFSEAVEKLLFSLYIIILSTAIVANGLVLLAYLLKIVKTSSFNLLLLNLSIADMVFAVGTLPSLFTKAANYTHLTGMKASFFCTIVIHNLPAHTGAMVNVITLSYVSFIRLNTFSSVIERSILKRKNVLIFIAVSWIFSFTYFAPNYFMFWITSTGACIPTHVKFYTKYIAVGSFSSWLIPIVILSANFARTVWMMWRRDHFEQSVMLQYRKQITILLLGLTLSFFLTFTPWATYLNMRALGYFKFGGLMNARVSKVLKLNGSLMTVTDPILYAFSWRGFRAGFAQSVMSKKRGKSEGSNTKKTSTTSSVKQTTLEEMRRGSTTSKDANLNVIQNPHATTMHSQL